MNLPAGASVTYTASCAVSAAATGTLSNTATVAFAGDPNPADNTATDSDTLAPTADLSVTKTDGVATAIPGDASGTVSNTATVAAPGGVTDPSPGNNSATDTDTLTPQADLAITKTDGVTTAV
ncbi:MAG: hypothetical protein IPF66_21675 [Holophagales bacterium]|nr:hypothetical protein [Holophagales bacterium]